MVKMIMDKGKIEVTVKGTNIEIMTQSCVLIGEVAKYLVSNCPDFLKDGVVDSFKDAINYSLSQLLPCTLSDFQLPSCTFLPS